jgi:hypothetical protein
MKANMHYIIVAVTVFLIGLSMGRHSRPSTETPEDVKNSHFKDPIKCLLAGGVRGTQGGKDVVFLPGIRMVFREEDWPDACWIPVASIQEIGEQEQIMAVTIRSSFMDEGWVVFESQRAVLLPRNEIAQLLNTRFKQLLEPSKLGFRAKSN